MKFLGANGDLHGLDPMGSANFLLGQDPHQWRTGLPTLQRIRYANLYAGIDLLYSGKNGRVKSEYTVAPGARPSDIRVEYSADLSTDASGRLHAAELIEDAPEIYQDTPSGRIRVAGRYRLLDTRTAGFEIDAYDASLPLVIDPVISYATYMGGTGLGAVTGVAARQHRQSVRRRLDRSAQLPHRLSRASRQRRQRRSLHREGESHRTGLIYATYIGGSGDDRAAAIAVDASGEAYVTGSTAPPISPCCCRCEPPWAERKPPLY